ncbi:MAG: hypothetical protein ABWX60_04010, partial [Aeromicrobium sp.]
MIDQIVVRRQALASLEAAEAAELLDYVDRARAAGERAGGQAAGTPAGRGRGARAVGGDDAPGADDRAPGRPGPPL